ncbi:MAG: malate dehydrogenase [Solitalea-like symbiont of Acarus siro]
MKVTIIGAGAVGTSCLEHIARLGNINEIVLLDVKEGYSEGKTMDLEQSYAALEYLDVKITGITNDYSKTENSDITIITSGIPRKPGMTREELIVTNANIVKTVANNAFKHSPNTIFIIVSNPMDTMTYLAFKSLSIEKQRIIGMGGILDSSRFKYYISKRINETAPKIDAMVIGGHGDTTMIPLYKKATVNNKKLTELLPKEEINTIVENTMNGGATLTKLIGTSAWIAPGASVANLVKHISNDSKAILPCSVYLDGQYDQKDLCIGVPVTITKHGWDKIVDIELDDDEKKLFSESANAVKNMNSQLKL